LAAAHTLLEELKLQNLVLTFQTLSGDLTVCKLADGSLQMNFPRNNCTQAVLGDSVQHALAESLALTKQELISFHFDDKSGKLIVEVKHFDSIKKAKPISERLLAISFPMGVRGVSITTNNLAGTEFHPEYDFASRYFAPWVGLDEDPVNGSSHTILAGFYGNRLGKKHLKAFMASERTGTLGVVLEDTRVLLIGFAATTLSGKITLPI